MLERGGVEYDLWAELPNTCLIRSASRISARATSSESSRAFPCNVSCRACRADSSRSSMMSCGRIQVVQLAAEL